MLMKTKHKQKKRLNDPSYPSPPATFQPTKQFVLYPQYIIITTLLFPRLHHESMMNQIRLFFLKRGSISLHQLEIQ